MSTNDDKAAEEYDAETDILRQRDKRTNRDIDPDEIRYTEDGTERILEMTETQANEMIEQHAPDYKDRYAIQSGAAGTWTVIRRVDKNCPDYPEDTPFEEFYSSVCICATPTMAVAISEALEKEHPHGDIV